MKWFLAVRAVPLAYIGPRTHGRAFTAAQNDTGKSVRRVFFLDAETLFECEKARAMELVGTRSV